MLKVMPTHFTDAPRTSVVARRMLSLACLHLCMLQDSMRTTVFVTTILVLETLFFQLVITDQYRSLLCSNASSSSEMIDPDIYLRSSA